MTKHTSKTNYHQKRNGLRNQYIRFVVESNRWCISPDSDQVTNNNCVVRCELHQYLVESYKNISPVGEIMSSTREIISQKCYYYELKTLFQMDTSFDPEYIASLDLYHREQIKLALRCPDQKTLIMVLRNLKRCSTQSMIMEWCFKHKVNPDPLFALFGLTHKRSMFEDEINTYRQVNRTIFIDQSEIIKILMKMNYPDLIVAHFDKYDRLIYSPEDYTYVPKCLQVLEKLTSN